MKRLSILLAAILFTVPAYAADIFNEPSEAAFVPAYSFSGPYLGLGIGYGMRNHDISISPLSFDGVGADGVVGDVFLGWQHQFQNDWLIGLEVALTFDDVKTEASLAGVGSLEAKHKNNLTYLAGIKAGRVIGDRTLVSIMPFWRRMEMDVNLSPAGGGGGASFSQQYDGLGLQLNAEVLATENWIVGVFGRGTWYDGESWGVTGLDVETNELEAGLRVSRILF